MEVCKHQQDKIRRKKKKKATVSKPQDHFIFTPLMQAYDITGIPTLKRHLVFANITLGSVWGYRSK